MKLTNIALTGARGAGKSKIARKLSKRIGWPLLSIDQLISYECEGRSISDIVSDVGWCGFRDIEFVILHKVVQMSGVIIDCGGGILVEAPVDEKSPELFSERKFKLLKKHTIVVYVKRDWDWMMLKAGLDLNRPDLGGDYKNLLEQRLPWYESSANFVLDMQGKNSVPSAVDELVRELLPGF